MIGDETVNRLENWKFTAANKTLDGAVTQRERDLIQALSAAFGDSGWFQGHVGELVFAVVSSLTRDAEPPDAVVAALRDELREANEGIRRLRRENKRLTDLPTNSTKRKAEKLMTDAKTLMADAREMKMQADGWRRSANAYVQQNQILREQLLAAGIEPDRRTM